LEEQYAKPATVKDAMMAFPTYISYADWQVAIFSESFVKKMADDIRVIDAELKDA
jgi:hypothetical protein